MEKEIKNVVQQNLYAIVPCGKLLLIAKPLAIIKMKYLIIIFSTLLIGCKSYDNPYIFTGHTFPNILPTFLLLKASTEHQNTNKVQ